MGGDCKSAVLKAHAASILSTVSEKTDIYLHEIVKALSAQGVCSSQNAVSYGEGRFRFEKRRKAENTRLHTLIKRLYGRRFRKHVPNRY